LQLQHDLLSYPWWSSVVLLLLSFN